MLKRINKKRFILINILNFLVIMLVILLSELPFAYSRYESNVQGDMDVNTAIYLVDETYEYVNIKLPELIPRDEGYVYNFTISNSDGTKRTDTNLKYDLRIVTTTNLPLEYVLYENGSSTSIIASDEVYADEHGTYFRKMTIPTRYFGFLEDESNSYRLVIYYRSDNLSHEFQGIIESLRIEIDSKQILEKDL